MSKTKDRAKEINQLKELLQDFHTDEYYKSDGFLLRWIQHANYDVKSASIAFRKSMDWRFQQQIDTILEEDFSDLEQRFPVDLSEVDKSGRVAVKIFVETFNCKNLDFHREGERYARFAYWTSEKIEKRIREHFYYTEGVVSQVSVIVDCTKMTDHMKDVGMRRLYAVLKFLKEVVSNLASNFPRGAEVTHVVNASKLFTVFHSALKHLSCKETVEALQIHGIESKFDWRAELF